MLFGNGAPTSANRPCVRAIPTGAFAKPRVFPDFYYPASCAGHPANVNFHLSTVARCQEHAVGVTAWVVLHALSEVAFGSEYFACAGEHVG
jgi:hypothetical protein